ncbi:MAG: AAA family ATPase [Candidatus Bathyarchaeota archaeon]|nr:AAA family ATPase [Candidatus Bathyarchaeota archaeon]MDW8040308.1 AAA family ATPase [Nitrososphaerota archaeon]
MLISEVILENFMSYEYARVPFKPGVNVICGPNGAGKSSLLLAISVALGQSYTERSRKLSDLIRWGKDQARVTLILDNSKRGGKRPVSKFNKDQIFLTRVLRRDGKYWFELENRAASKQDVERLLARLGVDPDNMLIIMHQNMVEQFTVLSPQEKLRMVEAAVGLEAYRENVLEAQRKLTRILSQEESISKLLESAEQTLNYWREQYERFQEKKQLMAKRRFLERELAWAEVNRRETIMEELEAKREKELTSLRQIEMEVKTAEEQLLNWQSQLEKLKSEWKENLNNVIGLEREKAGNQATILLCEQLIAEAALIENEAGSGQNLKFLRTENLKELVETSRLKIAKMDEELNKKRLEAKILEEQVEKVESQILDTRVRLALLNHRMENLKTNIEELEKAVKDAKVHLDLAVKKAEETGPRIAVVKSVSEILDEIRVTDGHLAALAGVSEEVERMYESYSQLYLELKEKARLVAENREKTLEEVKARMQAWRTVIQSLLNRVNLEYQKILAYSQAVGEVRLVNEHDIEAAGLEILVGFKGGKPVPLNAYTQSGGERTTATMSFLLALQQHMRSPFRAVDEYDVHMDPKNRELIAQVLISTVKNADSQYVVITPSQVTFAQKDVNIITVQNVEGKSVIKEVA